eukprot:1158499-Pelagomonas_calceolata.AAC.1
MASSAALCRTRAEIVSTIVTTIQCCYVPPGAALQNTQMLELWVHSDLHDPNEYGSEVRKCKCKLPELIGIQTTWVYKD